MTTTELRLARTTDRVFAALRWVQATRRQDPAALEALAEAQRDFDDAARSPSGSPA